MCEHSEMVKVVEETITIRNEWKRAKGGWQLPCGCIGPDIWHCDEIGQSECTECGRGWWQMGVKGGYCAMLDGKPQGDPVVILLPDMEVTDDVC